MLRIGAVCGVLAALAAAPAAAGDAATLNVIGFSRDGAMFAFEQHGEQDGSGYAYADLFVIDVATDSWVEGAPIRFVLEDDQPPKGPPGEPARRIVRQTGGDALLARHGIVEGLDGVEVVTRRLTDRSADGSFAVFAVDPIAAREYRMTLDVRPGPVGECGEPDAMFTLTLTGADIAPLVLHQDRGVPRSRGCPTGYGIAGIHLYPLGDPDSAAGPYAIAVLIAMTRRGFEGPDTRYLAVTAALDHLSMF